MVFNREHIQGSGYARYEDELKKTEVVNSLVQILMNLFDSNPQAMWSIDQLEEQAEAKHMGIRLREAVWQLVDEGKIEFMPDRRLKKSKSE